MVTHENPPRTYFWRLTDHTCWENGWPTQMSHSFHEYYLFYSKPSSWVSPFGWVQVSAPNDRWTGFHVTAIPRPTALWDQRKVNTGDTVSGVDVACDSGRLVLLSFLPSFLLLEEMEERNFQEKGKLVQYWQGYVQWGWHLAQRKHESYENSLIWRESGM